MSFFEITKRTEGVELSDSSNFELLITFKLVSSVKLISKISSSAVAESDMKPEKIKRNSLSLCTDPHAYINCLMS